MMVLKLLKAFCASCERAAAFSFLGTPLASLAAHPFSRASPGSSSQMQRACRSCSTPWLHITLFLSGRCSYSVACEILTMSPVLQHVFPGIGAVRCLWKGPGIQFLNTVLHRSQASPGCPKEAFLNIACFSPGCCKETPCHSLNHIWLSQRGVLISIGMISGLKNIFERKRQVPISFPNQELAVAIKFELEGYVGNIWSLFTASMRPFYISPF